MKKEYNTPEIEVTKFDVEDVITTSTAELVKGANYSTSFTSLFSE